MDNPILKAFAVFDHRHWLTSKKDAHGFGHDEIKLLRQHYEVFFPDTTMRALLECWDELMDEIMASPALMQRPFKSLWPHMLLKFTEHYKCILRLVAIMLLLPVDTSECERVFSLMNDIKIGTRSRLKQTNLRNLMIWNYHGKNLKAWELPFQEILDEFHNLAGKTGRRTHSAAHAVVSASTPNE